MSLIRTFPLVPFFYFKKRFSKEAVDLLQSYIPAVRSMFPKKHSSRTKFLKASFHFFFQSPEGFKTTHDPKTFSFDAVRSGNLNLPRSAAFLNQHLNELFTAPSLLVNLAIECCGPNFSLY
jgi:hypothetical protein